VASAVIKAYARQPIGLGLIVLYGKHGLRVRTYRLWWAECWDKSSRLDLIRETHRRILRLQTIFRLLRELRDSGESLAPSEDSVVPIEGQQPRVQRGYPA
jgi:hypothetical protein